MGACGSKEQVVEFEKGTPTTREAFKEHDTAESLEDCNTFFKSETDSALSRNLT
jgi:hypothetical protein